MKRSKIATILRQAEMISKAVEAEAEEILEDAEKAVKETVPACDVKKALLAIEKALEKEGIEALFQKSASAEAIKKTASESLTADELEKLVKSIADAVVDEFEDILADADEVADEEVTKLGDDEVDDEIVNIEGKLKSMLEKKLSAKGIYAKLNRKHKVAPKKAVANNALEAMKAKRKNRSAGK